MFKQVNCDGAIYTVPEWLDFQCPNVKPCKPIVAKNPWNVLHERYAAAIKSGQWNRANERKWLDEVFLGLVPCGECRARWKPLSDLMDLSDAATAFREAWYWHNYVNAEHVKPPLPDMPYEQCYYLWMGPRVAFVAGNYAAHGGTETFHKTLLPRLRHFRNIVGFGCMMGGGEASTLRVPYYEGNAAIRQLCELADVVVTWGTDALMQLMPPGKRVIAVHHGDLRSGWFRETIQQSGVQEFVCVNAEVADHIRTLRKEPVNWIPNAVDPERLKPRAKVDTEGKRICLFGHRMSAEKRPQFAAEIAGRLPEDWLLVMAGDGPDRPSNVGRNVRMVGHQETLADWLAVADCFISTSVFEGFGLSMAEAHAAGVPIVATPVGIAPQIAATLLPIYATRETWAEAIVASVGKQNKPHDFSVERHVEKWAEILR